MILEPKRKERKLPQISMSGRQFPGDLKTNPQGISSLHVWSYKPRHQFCSEFEEIYKPQETMFGHIFFNTAGVSLWKCCKTLSRAVDVSHSQSKLKWRSKIEKSLLIEFRYPNIVTLITSSVWTWLSYYEFNKRFEEGYINIHSIWGKLWGETVGGNCGRKLWDENCDENCGVKLWGETVGKIARELWGKLWITGWSDWKWQHDWEVILQWQKVLRHFTNGTFVRENRTSLDTEKKNIFTSSMTNLGEATLIEIPFDFRASSTSWKSRLRLSTK